jgi:hypothetical protein
MAAEGRRRKRLGSAASVQGPMVQVAEQARGELWRAAWAGQYGELWLKITVRLTILPSRTPK